MRNRKPFDPEARKRIQALSKILSEQLRSCSAEELGLLIRYYIGGQSEDQVLRETGVSQERFAQLRMRVRRFPTARATGHRPVRSMAAGQ